MDVNIHEVTSEVHVTDARALLTPEVLAQVVAEVLRALRDEELLAQSRRQDTELNRQALALD